MTDPIPSRAADLWATYTVGTHATPQAQVWGWANTSASYSSTVRPLTDELVAAFCRLHDAAVALKEAWS